MLFVGGTALYLKALLHGLWEGPGEDEAVRVRLRAEAEALGREALHPAWAGSTRPRLGGCTPTTSAASSGLEVWELTGRPFSAWQGQ